jgi:hypothetical protein
VYEIGVTVQPELFSATSVAIAEYVVVAFGVAATVIAKMPPVAGPLQRNPPLQLLVLKIFTVEPTSAVPLIVGPVLVFDGDVGLVDVKTGGVGPDESSW